jgi:hypothetical protein
VKMATGTKLFVCTKTNDWTCTVVKMATGTGTKLFVCTKTKDWVVRYLVVVALSYQKLSRKV